jgi:glycerophosphoryl diester phosphodiesterase
MDTMEPYPPLGEIGAYANAVGVNKALITKAFIAEAHAKGLLVHAWTYRAEKNFLLPGAADVVSELKSHLAIGLDGFFTDNPDLGRKALSR